MPPNVAWTAAAIPQMKLRSTVISSINTEKPSPPLPDRDITRWNLHASTYCSRQ